MARRKDDFVKLGDAIQLDFITFYYLKGRVLTLSKQVYDVVRKGVMVIYEDSLHVCYCKRYFFVEVYPLDEDWEKCHVEVV